MSNKIGLIVQRITIEKFRRFHNVLESDERCL